MKNSVAKIALALVAMITMAGCPSKKNSNQFASPYGYQNGYNQYNGMYCNQLNGCYGQGNYGQMFTTGLGKINSSHLQAEVAINFSTVSAVNGFTMNSWQGNTQMVATMNVYQSSGFCPIPPGQYQLQGTGNFGYGAMSLSFTGTLGAGNYVRIEFPSNFLSPMNTYSIMGPQFRFAVQNSVYVQSPYGSCGVFVME